MLPHSSLHSWRLSSSLPPTTPAHPRSSTEDSSNPPLLTPPFLAPIYPHALQLISFAWLAREMRRGDLSLLFFFLFCQHASYCNSLNISAINSLTEVGLHTRENDIAPTTSPASVPQPLVPFLSPTQLIPFANTSFPKLSGRCAFNFTSVEDLMSTTSIDCCATFAPFLANVICCPQLEATLIVLLGQSSKRTGMLALDATHANYCLSDVQQILGSQGANPEIQKVCPIRALNLTQLSCPISDANVFESMVDTSRVLTACQKVDPVNECCSQICQNAIIEASRTLAVKSSLLTSRKGAYMLPEQSTVSHCKGIVLRWLASKLDPSSAKQVLRSISNCNVNKVCPLEFPDTKVVAKDCGSEIRNHTACCHSLINYVSHLQKQSFITNLQALNCAASLGVQLQKLNVSRNVYSLCHITLKHFSVQVGSQESGCLLPSLPSDVTFDMSSGISFTCDLNDNIAAPWPLTSQLPTSCNNSVHMPALPTATSSGTGINSCRKNLLPTLASFLVLGLIV